MSVSIQFGLVCFEKVFNCLLIKPTLIYRLQPLKICTCLFSLGSTWRLKPSTYVALLARKGHLLTRKKMLFDNKEGSEKWKAHATWMWVWHLKPSFAHIFAVIVSSSLVCQSQTKYSTRWLIRIILWRQITSRSEMSPPGGIGKGGQGEGPPFPGILAHKRVRL